MALYFDFKEKMAIEFGRLIGLKVEPSELVLGETTAPPEGMPYDAMMSVTARGQTRQIAFNRIDLAGLVSNIPQEELIVAAPKDATKLHDVIDLINNRLGTRFVKEDVQDADLSPGTFMVWIKAVPNHPYYKGQLQIPIKIKGVITEVRPALHAYDLQGSTVDTGSEPIDMGVAFNYQTIGDKKFAFLAQPAGHVPFAPGLKFKVAGDFTVDMELYIDGVYGYLYMMTNLASGTGSGNTYGTFAFYTNKFYHYGVTASGSPTWQNQMPAIPAKTPTRLTLRSLQGFTYAYVNGVYVTQWPSQPASMDTALVGFRNADGTVSQWPSGCGLANFKYWDVGLSNAEMDILFGKPSQTNRPVHDWPLAFDGRNEGESVVPWAAPMTYVEIYGRKMARCASQGAAFGAAFNFNQPFTLQFDYYASAVGTGLEGIFGTSALTTVNGVLKLAYGLLFVNGGDVTFSTADIAQNKQIVKLTLMRDATGKIHGWCDNTYLGYTTIPANSPLLTHFGKAGEVLSMVTNHFANIKYWEEAFDIEGLREIIGPKVQMLSLCKGGSGLSGATVIFDGNMGTFWNATGDPTVTGLFPEEMVGKYIHSFRVHQATDSTNWKKKVKTWYIDQKDINGNWVNIFTSATTFCRNAIPDNETVQLTVPVLVTGRDVRIRGVGHWGDQFYYRWCNEILFHYGENREGVFGGSKQPPQPLHHWPLNGDTTNKGRDTTSLMIALDWIDRDGKRWGYHATPRHQALGVSLANNVAFTLQFRILSLTNQVANKIQGIFGDSTGADNTTAVKINCNDSPDGNYFAYVPGTYSFNRLIEKAYLPDTENVVTIRGLGGVVSVWLNGLLVLKSTFASSQAWTHLGKVGNYMDSNQLLRDIKYWDTHLTDLELDYLFHQNATEPAPEIPDTPGVVLVNPYPELPFPVVGWGFDETNPSKSVGRLTEIATLSQTEFETVEFQGEQYFSPKSNMGELPLALAVDRDFTLDFEIVASTYADSAQYGSILTSVRATTLAEVSRAGEFLTWRNISAANNNAPVLQGMGYSGAGDSLMRPGLGDFKTRVSLRRKGNVFSWWRNGVLVWTFTNTTKPNAWKFFGSILKRALHLGRKFAFWDIALTDLNMARLLGAAFDPIPQALHDWRLIGDTTNLGSDGRALPGTWTTYEAAGKTFMKPNAAVAIPTSYALNTAGDYTIDFEVSYNAPASYAAFMPTASWQSKGAFTYYSGKLYHYLVSTGGLTGPWTNQPAVTQDAPVRYTIVARGNTEYWYINGTLAWTDASAGPGSLILQGLTAGIGLRNFAYWPSALTDAELRSLLERP